MSEEVVALGAWCDLRPPDGSTRTPGSVHFDVSEFAILADGRRVVLHRERGFGGVARTAGQREPLDFWLHMTRERLEADVLTVVSPEDDSDEQGHPWRWLRSLLLEHGIEASVEHLRRVPYAVELSERVEQRLGDGDPARPEATD